MQKIIGLYKKARRTPPKHNLGVSLIGSSQKISQLSKEIHQISLMDTPILIRGEKGAGKKQVAHVIHKKSSRRYSPLFSVHCPNFLVQNFTEELLGYDVGAPRGYLIISPGWLEVLGKSTLLLNDVDSLDLRAQKELAELLRKKKFFSLERSEEVTCHTQIIATSSCDLEMMVTQRTFLKELLDILSFATIWVPPLRERRDDIESLIHFFIKAKSPPNRTIGIQPDALTALKLYDWPGNVAELRSAIDSTFMLKNSESITLESLPEMIQLKALYHKWKNGNSFAPHWV